MAHRIVALQDNRDEQHNVSRASTVDEQKALISKRGAAELSSCSIDFLETETARQCD
jgi:hypothetical protein